MDHLYVAQLIPADWNKEWIETVGVQPALNSLASMVDEYGYTEFATPQQPNGNLRVAPNGIGVLEYTEKDEESGLDKLVLEVFAGPAYEGKLDGE